MPVRCRASVHRPTLHRRPLLPLPTLPASVRHYPINDRPVSARRILRDRREDKVRVWDPGDGWLKAFCVECGSHTHTLSPDDPTLVAIRMGCLDREPGIRPQAHQFVEC